MTGLQKFVIKRLILNVFVIFSILTILFTLFKVLPAEPDAIFVDEGFSQEFVAKQRELWGLNKPVWEQYAIYIKNMFTFNFGVAFFGSQPVAALLREKLLNTFAMLLPAVVIATVLGTLIGAVAGWRRGSTFEKVTVTTSLFLRSTPSYFVGLLALMVFAYQLRWMPSGGMITPGTATGFWAIVTTTDFLHHLILPTLVLVTREITGPAMLLRSSMLEVKGSDFLETLRAKGLPEYKIIIHATRNAMLPLITDVAVMTGHVFQGQVLLETIFAWPGIGREIVTALSDLDYPVAQAAFFLIALSVLTMNFVADMLYGVVDPRITYN